LLFPEKTGILHAKGMPSITIKKFPEALLDQLRTRAAAARRSVTQEVLAILENSFAESVPPGAANYPESARQAEAWAGLSGKWKSDLTVQEEIDRLYKTRKNRKTPEL
jgi:plasmid stability protein